MKKKKQHGLNKEDYIHPVRWKVDYDYVQKLKPEEAQWLAGFTRDYLNAPPPENTSYQAKRRFRKDHANQENAARRDIMARGKEKAPPGTMNVDRSISEASLYARVDLARALKDKKHRSKFLRLTRRTLTRTKDGKGTKRES